MNNPSRVRILGPLAVHRNGLVKDLRNQGYTPQSSTKIVLLMAYIGRWLSKNDLQPERFTTDKIEAFLRQRRRSGCREYVTVRGLQPVLGYLRRLGIIPSEDRAVREQTPFDKPLEDYEAYLVRERSLSPGIVNFYRDRARHFLSTTLNVDAPHLARLTTADISSYILGQARTSSVGYAKLKVTALRSFLRYLHVQGEVSRDLSGALPPVAGWRLVGLPKGLTDDETNRLLEASDLRTRTGRRDYAVVLLMLRLGLRANEVASLTLDDVNWSQGQLMVRGKGKRQDLLPLSQDVGEAIMSYLRRGHPHCASRSLFLCARAPRKGLTSDAVAMIIRTRGAQCGIARLGSHRLRHTAATQMLRNGASLPEIGQVLRHQSMSTTAIYAKVDRRSLMTVCRPWPEVKP